MILGTGLDIVEVARIRTMYSRFGERLLERVLRPSEIQYCISHKDPSTYLAVRFAAKEAVSKALGTGIGAELGWQDIEVVRKETGEPQIALHGKGLLLLGKRRGTVVHISLSHTAQYAAAVAILE